MGRKTLLVTSEPNKPSKDSILGKTGFRHLVLARSEFSKLVGAPNKTLRLITINYMFKYTFWIKPTLLELLRKIKSPSKARFQKN